MVFSPCPVSGQTGRIPCENSDAVQADERGLTILAYRIPFSFWPGSRAAPAIFGAKRPGTAVRSVLPASCLKQLRDSQREGVPASGSPKCERFRAPLGNHAEPPHRSGRDSSVSVFRTHRKRDDPNRRAQRFRAFRNRPKRGRSGNSSGCRRR